MKEQIVSKLRESADLKLKFAKDSISAVEEAAKMIGKSLESGGKILIFGNGGSAADSQHIAAELVNRYARKRKALASLALTTDTSVITSVSNDSSFSNIFSRQIEALGRKGDVAWAITTGGKSANVIKGLETAQSMGLKTIVFCGQETGKVKDHADCCVSVPSKSTPRIQELHITLAHIISEWIEESIVKE